MMFANLLFALLGIWALDALLTYFFSVSGKWLFLYRGGISSKYSLMQNNSPDLSGAGTITILLLTYYVFHYFRKGREDNLGPQLGKFKERWFGIWGIDPSLGMSDGWRWLFEGTLAGLLPDHLYEGSVCGISMGARLDFLITWWQQKERTFYKQTNTQPEWTWMTYLWPNLGN